MSQVQCRNGGHLKGALTINRGHVNARGFYHKTLIQMGNYCDYNLKKCRLWSFNDVYCSMQIKLKATMIEIEICS